MTILKLKKNCYRHKTRIFWEMYVDIEKILGSRKISFGEKTISTLMDTCIMVLKLSH